MVRTIVIPQHKHDPVHFRELADIDEFTSVTGGWIRALPLDGLQSTLWVDQTAVVSAGDFNPRATVLIWHYSSLRTPIPLLFGDVVLSGESVNGEEVAVEPPAIAEAFVGAKHFIIQLSPKDEERWQNTYMCFDDIFEAITWCLLVGFAHVSTWDVRISVGRTFKGCSGHTPSGAVV